MYIIQYICIIKTLLDIYIFFALFIIKKRRILKSYIYLKLEKLFDENDGGT